MFVVLSCYVCYSVCLVGACYEAVYEGEGFSFLFGFAVGFGCLFGGFLGECVAWSVVDESEEGCFLFLGEVSYEEFEVYEFACCEFFVFLGEFDCFFVSFKEVYKEAGVYSYHLFVRCCSSLLSCLRASSMLFVWSSFMLPAYCMVSSCVSFSARMVSEKLLFPFKLLR